MPNEKKINNIPMCEAETKEEKLLLGFIRCESERIGWGQINIEFTIKNGKLVHIRSNEVSKTLNIGELVG